MDETTATDGGFGDLDKFEEFPKIFRLYRDIIVTEKIDGTNAQVCVNDTGTAVRAGSRNRWIVPGEDGFGFASWVKAHETELLALGPGRHFGEWWGAGIQRKYATHEKRLSLFNTSRWGDASTRPACCHVVPVLYQGPFSEEAIRACAERLRVEGSVASPGFMNPEGICVFHVQSNALFKWTPLDGDGHKGAKAR